MTELLTAAQMRGIEKAAMDRGDVTGFELMERAGCGVVEAIFEEWPELVDDPQRAVVLCGPGNNGGDGFVIARLLQQADWQVELFLYGEPERLPLDAAEMRRLWEALGNTIPMTEEAAATGLRPTLLIDAMFGTGLTRPIPIECARTFRAIEQRDTGSKKHRWLVPFHRIAVDCPSGFDSNSGEILLPDIRNDAEAAQDPGVWHEEVMEKEIYPRLLQVDLTVTFHRQKVGHGLCEVGRRSPVVVDIGLKQDPSGSQSDIAQLVDPCPDGHKTQAKVWLSTYANIAARGHKYDRGHAFVVAGGSGKGGAARLVARAALRVGAGLVTVGVPSEALVENASQLNAVMLNVVDTPRDLETMLADDRISALALGPGLGLGGRTRDIVSAALGCSVIHSGQEKRRFVLDADALSSFAERPDALFELCHSNCVLTPHDGEFARLFPDLAQQIKRAPFGDGISRLEAAKQAASRSGAIIVLKGTATVAAHPDGGASIHSALYDRAAPQLATAGSGDVLTGLIVGTLAGPMASFHMRDSVECAIWLHVECARAFGPGLIAEDLPEMLPQVFRDLGV